jgi:glyoxylase-like metal-dependent hydrolase (beta-lactamase superfamily II)
MSAKATFAFFETSGGASIHRIPLEVFPKFWAYVYLVRKHDYCALIDAGSGTDASHEQLLSGLQQVGTDPGALTHIFLTHAHIDHFGGLARLRPLTSARLGVHELDVQTVAHHESRLALIERRLRIFLTETGLVDETREQILGIYRFTKGLYHSVPVDFTYAAAGMQLGPFEFIHLAGHCPGHVAIRVDDVLFCGDMVVEGVTPHLSPESITPYSGLDHYLDSLARLEQWSTGARLVLNGHNDVITDLPATIDSTKQNILRRMSKALEALSAPLTIEEVCRAVYGETGGYNQLLVIEKAGAYVEYFYEHGMIEIANPDELERGMPVRYRKLGDGILTLTELGRRAHMYAGTQVRT